MTEAAELDEVVREFLVESHESLDQLDRDLVALEKDPTSKDRLASVFRTIHTIKGTCGFLSFGKLEHVAHVGENLLSRLRDGRLVLNADITSALLAMVDAVRHMLSDIESTGNDGDQEYEDLVARLNELQEALEGPAEPAQAAAASANGSTPRAVEPAPAAPAAPVATVAEAAESAPAAVNGEHAPQAQNGEQPETHASAVADTTIRVDVHLLDKLMNLVGELVLARNQILKIGAGGGAEAAFVSASQRLNLITTELQEGVMKTRMRPIGSLWNKFPRVVRDLALACGKEIRLEMEGGETELDRTILEAIKDPLTHILRNAVDHGIEGPESRLSRGKTSSGLLALRAFHEGGKVNIEITDDGQGIDPERVRNKAVDRGVVSAAQAARMSDREIVNLVFSPGFSTAESVSNISGRGVGMDVVKTNVERISGSVELSSRPGAGTTLKIKIPLTLAIIPALVVCLGDERYAIPQVNLLELVRLDAEQSQSSIQRIHGAPVMRLRGNLLPLVELRHVLGEPSTLGDSRAVNVVVVQADDRTFGLVVDGVSDTEEIVVKPLGRELKGVSTFAGATIMGDGKVALILDVVGVAQRAGVLSEVRERSLALAGKGSSLDNAHDSKDALLLLERGTSTRLALPLALVSRLEEFPRSSIEHVGRRMVVQYRGDILPLATLDDLLGPGDDDAADQDTVQVVVFTEKSGSVGLVVGRIVDIVQDSISAKKTGARHGVRGTAVIHGKVTELLDVEAALSVFEDAA